MAIAIATHTLDAPELQTQEFSESSGTTGETTETEAQNFSQDCPPVSSPSDEGHSDAGSEEIAVAPTPEVDVEAEAVPDTDFVPAEKESAVQGISPDENLLKEIRSLREQISCRQQTEEEIRDCSSTVEKLAVEVMSAESEVKSAQGELKSAREKYEIAVRELRQLIQDSLSGQGRLPFSCTLTVPNSEQNSETITETASTAMTEVAVENSDAGAGASDVAVANEEIPVDPHLDDQISVLSQKSMKALVGNDEFLRLKSIEEPIGMTDKELELLESAGNRTIGLLERNMRQNEWWHSEIGRGWGEGKTNKLINSLRVFRQKYPQPA